MNKKCKSSGSDFYRNKTWELVLQDQEVKTTQLKQGEAIDAINRKMSYIYGITAAVSFIITLAVNLFRGKLPNPFK